jgi:hypothetical protein
VLVQRGYIEARKVEKYGALAFTVGTVIENFF